MTHMGFKISTLDGVGCVAPRSGFGSPKTALQLPFYLAEIVVINSVHHGSPFLAIFQFIFDKFYEVRVGYSDAAAISCQ
jgi:hypothetical protein